MKRIWVKKFNSFKSATKSDEEYYLNMTSEQRLEIVQFLRENYSKLSKGKKDENRKGLRRFIKIIQQT